MPEDGTGIHQAVETVQHLRTFHVLPLEVHNWVYVAALGKLSKAGGPRNRT